MRFLCYSVLLGCLGCSLARPSPSKATSPPPETEAQQDKGVSDSGPVGGPGGPDGGPAATAAAATPKKRLHARAEPLAGLDAAIGIAAGLGATLGIITGGTLSIRALRWFAKERAIRERTAFFKKKWEVSDKLARCVAEKCWDPRRGQVAPPESVDTLIEYMTECGNQVGEPLLDAESRVYNMFTREDRIFIMGQVARVLRETNPDWTEAIAICVARKMIPAEGRVPLSAEQDIPKWYNDCVQNAGADPDADGPQRRPGGNGGGSGGGFRGPRYTRFAQLSRLNSNDAFASAVARGGHPVSPMMQAATLLQRASRLERVDGSPGSGSRGSGPLWKSLNPADPQVRKHLLAALRSSMQPGASVTSQGLGTGGSSFSRSRNPAARSAVGGVGGVKLPLPLIGH